MQGTKYLSELISETDFQTDALNLLVAPCGSGKTTLFLNKIAGALPDKHRMLYLIDTSLGNQYLIHQHRDVAKFYDDNWLASVSTPGAFMFEERKVVIITYAKFGWLVRDNPDFGNFFDYIVCDEFHNCFDFSHMPQRKTKYDAYRAAIQQLRHVAANGRTKVIAITATPALVEKEYNAPIIRIPYDTEVVCRYETHNVIPYADNVYWQNRIAGKGVIYTTHITKMKEFQSLLGARAISIWSPNSTDDPMDDEQNRAREYIIEHERIPDNYDYLIINKSMGTAITLQGQIDFIVVNSEEKDLIEQVRGRYRDDLATLYTKDTKAIPQIEVPSQYLGRKLNAEERTTLAAALSKTIPSKPIAWPTMEKIIIANGYNVRRGKSGKTNYRLIEPKECSKIPNVSI
ncbi:MAG: hypothetical protein E7337_00270 [Clostridiales bacterium]|nr:hypothetical protein [Clostridiales bacterium]